LRRGSQVRQMTIAKDLPLRKGFVFLRRCAGNLSCRVFLWPRRGESGRSFFGDIRTTRPGLLSRGQKYPNPLLGVPEPRECSNQSLLWAWRLISHCASLGECAERYDAASPRFPTGGPLRNGFVQHLLGHVAESQPSQICALKEVRSRYLDSVPFLGQAEPFPGFRSRLPVHPPAGNANVQKMSTPTAVEAFPVFDDAFPCYCKLHSLLFFGQRKGKSPGIRAPARFQPRAFQPEFRDSLYFSLFFAAETGSPPDCVVKPPSRVSAVRFPGL
jgi:hypothetical protein